MQTEIAFAEFSQDHIKGAVALSEAAGWPHRIEDWSLVLNLSKGVVAFADDRIVATAVATPFGPVATANMIIVDKTMRGQGLGRKIMETAMRGIEAEEWRLVATRQGLPLYQKMGFEACGEIRQFQGTARATAPSEVMKTDGPDADGLIWATGNDVPELAELDFTASGMNRKALVQTLLRSGKILCVRQGGKILAWAAIRPFGRGCVAGPVIGRTGSEAQRLLDVMIAECDGQFLRVDTTADAGLDEWLPARGLELAGGGIAMRRGTPVPVSKIHHTYALASQALG